MSAVPLLREELAGIGYTEIVADYVFSDVFAPAPFNRSVRLAAFTQTPPSYRNAAIAIVESDQREPAEIAADYRASGAPLVFVVRDRAVIVWQINASGSPSAFHQTTVEHVRELFNRHREIWSPRRIQSAKSLAQLDRSFQLDFVDIGLLPAIEGEIHDKLDRLLNETRVSRD